RDHRVSLLVAGPRPTDPRLDRQSRLLGGPGVPAAAGAGLRSDQSAHRHRVRRARSAHSVDWGSHPMSSSSVATPLVAPPRAREVPARGGWVRRQHSWLQILIRIASNPMGAFGLGTVVIMAMLAILAPVIAPYSPIAQHPGQELKPPGAEFWLG